MRLSRVVLDFAYKIPGSVMKTQRYELTEEDAAREPGSVGSMRFDRDTFSLVFGDCDYGVHWSHVREWERANLELECDKCDAVFKNEQGRSMHRKACKGKAA
jgi:hypothetical protein